MIERLVSTGLGIYLCLVGAGLMIAALKLAITRIQIANGARADGVIVGYTSRWVTRRGRPPSQMTRVRFTASSGETIEFQSRMGGASHRWPIGSSIPVRYLRDQPAMAEIATAGRLALAPLVVLVLALGCFLTAWRAGAGG